MAQLDLAAELERRDLGVAELAKQAGLSRGAVARIASGQSPGRPRSRRLLREPLKQYPPVEPLDVRAEHAARLAHLAARQRAPHEC